MNPAKAFAACLLCSLPLAIFAQKGCSEKVSLISVQDAVGGSVQIELEVISKGSFRGKVISNSNATEAIIREFSGSGTTRILIDNLDKKSFTTVSVEFDGQKDFLCKSKVLPDIFSTDKQ